MKYCIIVLFVISFSNGYSQVERYRLKMFGITKLNGDTIENAKVKWIQKDFLVVNNESKKTITIYTDNPSHFDVTRSSILADDENYRIRQYSVIDEYGHQHLIRIDTLKKRKGAALMTIANDIGTTVYEMYPTENE